jgi:transcriptional regulator with XRE-family HTH domain
MTTKDEPGQTSDVTPDEAAEIDRLIAANVRAYRARLQLTQQELADQLDWSRKVMGALEAGTRRVTVADAMLLCQALQIPLAELLRVASEDGLRALGLRSTG